MSGDVQPRKRKDKKRKRDALDRKSEGEVTFSRQSSVQDDDESSHGVHMTKMGSDDVHLHVQHEHGTGGHWCAKILFFSLLVVLGGLVALIIMENRGLSDLDTPLSESRFSNYFDGWVEEHRQEHDEHDAVKASIAEHDEHDEPFEEEEDDHSEGDEDDDEEEGEEEDHDGDEEEEVAEDDGDDDTEEVEADKDEEDEDDEVVATTEQTQEEDDDDDDAEDEDEERNESEPDEDGDDEQHTVEESVEDEPKTVKNDNYDDDDNDNNAADNGDDDDDDVSEPIKPLYTRTSHLHTHNVASQQRSNAVSDVDDDDPFDEDDDDGTFESSETVVDNDAEELLLLQKKARQQAAEAAKNAPPSAEDDTDDIAEAVPSWASSLEEPAPESIMKRRLTIATAEDMYPEDEEEPLLPVEDEFSEEEIEIEEEIEYVEEEDEVDIEDIDDRPKYVRTGSKEYVPETFEQLNAMHKQYTEPAAERLVSAALKEMGAPEATKKATAVFYAPPPPPVVDRKTGKPPEPEPALLSKNTAENVAFYGSGPSVAATKTASPEKKTAESTQGTTLEVTHDLDYQPEDEDIDYDADNMSDGEEEDELDDDADDDDEADDDDISDVDDTDLMNRLEMKYGRLPQKEYESDEDPDDPTWTQIKPKETLGGGPQAHDDVDTFEKELRRANEEMMRENYAAALKAFELLSRKYPDRPQAFLGKAKALDQLSERKRSNNLLNEALQAYKRYLAFGRLIDNDAEYRAVAEHCIERIHFLGTFMQAIPIHEELLERFSADPSIRNQLAVTLLMQNRLVAAKMVLQETLRRWPKDGYALVHYGYVLNQHDKDYKNAAIYLQRGINTKAEGTQDGRFYFHLGDALHRLGRPAAAMEVYKRGAELQLFPSVYQRSLYNEPHLRAYPYWQLEETTYAQHLTKLEQNWLAIRAEGLNALSKSGYFLDETEDLRDVGDWKQFDLYVSGQRLMQNCQKAPITCSLIERFTAASGCRRGQVKFSVMHAGTHVWPHCGPTNCRLRAHLGLVVPTGTHLRVADQESNWTEGKFLIFDDSFEHEVWHNGSSLRLVLIVDIWHPDLSEEQRRNLTPI